MQNFIIHNLNFKKYPKNRVFFNEKNQMIIYEKAKKGYIIIFLATFVDCCRKDFLYKV